MSDTHYQVVMTGSVDAGSDAQAVADSLTKLFRIAEDNARTLLAGSETVIKRGVDSRTAQKYVQAIQKAGASCRVEAMSSAEPVAGALTSSAVPPPPIPAASIVEPPRSEPTPDRGAVPAAVTDLYARPSAAPGAEPDHEPGELHAPIRIEAGRGFGWLEGGLDLVFGAPGTWVMMFVGYIVLSILVSLVPVLGWLVTSLFFPVITAGIMLGAHSQHAGSGIRFSHLFSGFKSALGALVGVGGVYLGGTIVIAGIAILAMLSLGGSLAFLAVTSEGGAELDPATASTMVSSVAVLGLVFLALLIPLLMAIWFAPALIALHGRALGEALKWSFTGCVRNWLAFLVYGIAMFLLMGVVMAIVGVSGMLLGPFVVIPAVLVTLFIVPVMFASIYISYREIFVD